MKLEVGKIYQLKNGRVVKCTEMIGDDPTAHGELGDGVFILGGYNYHQDGTFCCGCMPELNVKRSVELETSDE